MSREFTLSDMEHVGERMLPEEFSNRARQKMAGIIRRRFGQSSLPMRALELVCDEMCAEKDFKRNDGESYYVHCIAVAKTLLNAKIDEPDVICAALLHDIIEDVPGYNESKVAKLFNARVAKMVQLVSKKPNMDYKEANNINGYLEGIMNYPDENIAFLAAAIKAADIRHNSLSWKKLNPERLYKKACDTQMFYLPFLYKCCKEFPLYEFFFDAAIDPTYAVIFQITRLYEDGITPLEIENDWMREYIEGQTKKIAELEAQIAKLQKR